jgi:hypothetical protein
VTNDPIRWIAPSDRKTVPGVPPPEALAGLRASAARDRPPGIPLVDKKTVLAVLEPRSDSRHSPRVRPPRSDPADRAPAEPPTTLAVLMPAPQQAGGGPIEMNTGDIIAASPLDAETRAPRVAVPLGAEGTAPTDPTMGAAFERARAPARKPRPSGRHRARKK